MRLLIVNPNTSDGVTRRINAAAQAVALSGDVFNTVSSPFGPELIITAQDGVDAVDGVMACVAANVAGVDGIVLASFGDTGTEAVQSAYPHIPVIGIACAAFATARCLGGKYSIVTFDESTAPALRTRAIFHGMGDSLHRLEAVVDDSPFDAADVQVERFDSINALCRDCAKDSINSIVLGGSPLAGLSTLITTSPKVPVIDGTQAAIGLLRSAL